MELICYLHPAWTLDLRPASSRRAWMEATPDRYAYRCLPLAIANAHGWELGSPCGFEARWTGGDHQDAVELRLDPGTDPAHAPRSLFGSGTITFHVEALFRTAPGWNLWVGGAPNDAKDGIAPLGGVIETDWSPYTFTMNWRFTRTNRWVRWEKGEAFCFLFPVQRGALDALVPEIRPLADMPDLESSYLGWSASRAAFQEQVRRTRPIAPTDQWQKLYYRGIHPPAPPPPRRPSGQAPAGAARDRRGLSGERRRAPTGDPRRQPAACRRRGSCPCARPRRMAARRHGAPACALSPTRRDTSVSRSLRRTVP